MSRFVTLVAASAVLALTAAAPASAAVHHRHHAMMSNGGHHRHLFYGVGDAGQTPRTTATGGNAGGYSNRN